MGSLTLLVSPPSPPNVLNVALNVFGSRDLVIQLRENFSGLCAETAAIGLLTRTIGIKTWNPTVILVEYASQTKR